MKRTKGPVSIAYVHPYRGLYGAGRSLLETMRTLDRSKFTPHLVVTHEGPFEEEAKEMGFDPTLFLWLSGVTWKNPKAWLSSVWRLSRWFRRKGIRIVELNLWPGAIDGGVLYIAARLSGAFFILRNHVELPRWLSLYDKWWIARADRILSVSRTAVAPALQKRRSDLWSKVHPERIVVIPSGRNLEALQEEASSKDGSIIASLGIPEDSRIVGMVGALRPGKRQDLFVRAAALVRRSVPNAYFLIVGDVYFNSPEEKRHIASVHQWVETLQLSQRVIFTGYRRDAVSLMKHFDVLVLPSRSEAFATVLIEAMALGVPSVAASVGGIPEVMRDGETALLVDSSEPEAYADAIVRLLTDEELMQRIRKKAKERSSDFDSESLTRLVERQYGELISGRGR